MKSIVLPLWERAPVLVRAVQGEADSRTILATLSGNGGTPADLTGASARLYVEKPDGTKVFQDGTVSDAAGGICSFTLSSGITAVPGIASCQILLSWPDGRTLKAIGPSLEILPSGLDGAAESVDDFSALTTALNKADSSTALAAQSAANARQAADDAQTAGACADAVCLAASAAASMANAAAETANQAAQNTGLLYRMLNPLTGQTAFVTDIIGDLSVYMFRDAVTAQKLDGLNRTSQDFDTSEIAAVDFDTGAKMKLGVI